MAVVAIGTRVPGSRRREIDHAETVASADRHHGMRIIGQLLHDRPGDLQHVHVGEQREPQGQHPGAELVLAELFIVIEVPHPSEGIGQPGDGRFRQAGALGDLLVAQMAIPRLEAAQDLEPARQGGDELAVVAVLGKRIDAVPLSGGRLAGG